MQKNEFVSADLYLSAALAILLNIEPRYKVEGGKTLFIFDVTDKLYTAMNAYNSGTSINALEYANTLKRLKAEMLMRRSMSAVGANHV